MSLNRRSLISAGAIAAVAGAARAQTAAPAPAGLNPALAMPAAIPQPGPGTDKLAGGVVLPVIEPSLVIPLWPGQPPGGGDRPPVSGPYVQTNATTRNIAMPTLGVYRPAKPDGSAVIVCPGGGYTGLSMSLEGSTPASMLTAQGVTVFRLAYRLPGEMWRDRSNVPLQDAQRAIRIIRSRASEFGLDPQRIGIMGFSAGGHLASCLATVHARQTYAPIDAIDAQPTRPNFAGLIYPVITMRKPLAYPGGIPNLLGPNPTDAQVAAWSTELQVTAETAPCFIAHGLNDHLVPPDNGVMMLAALREKQIAAEGLLFQDAQHGFGMGVPGQSNQHWPAVFLDWMRALKPASVG